METLTELRSLIFSNISWALWIAAFFFAIIGIVINVLFGVVFRTVASTNTPNEFDWSFFRADNKKRFWYSLILSALIVFVVLRFFPEFTGKVVSPFWALAIGLGLDYVINTFYLKKSSWIKKIFTKK